MLHWRMRLICLVGSLAMSSSERTRFRNCSLSSGVEKKGTRTRWPQDRRRVPERVHSSAVRTFRPGRPIQRFVEVHDCLLFKSLLLSARSLVNMRRLY